MEVTYQDILLDSADGVATITINRPGEGNLLRRQSVEELADALRRLWSDSDVRVIVITGAGDRFFCLGGEHGPAETLDPPAVLQVVDVYELIDSMPKPVIASVNGFAVGAGNVLHTVCDLSIASENAIFRQVGPIVGSFDAGFGTWYLEETIGRKRAKEMWYLNPKVDAHQALAWGLVNEVVAHDELRARTREIAADLKTRGAQALAALKTTFSSRHTGVVGQSRLALDLLVAHYYRTEEAQELSQAFEERRAPDESRFNR